MFEIMDAAGKIYEGLTPYKTPIRADSKRASHGRKPNRGESALPTNPEKGRSSKHKTRNAGHPSDCPTGGKNSCFISPGTPQKSEKY